jgi:hypothetical protein
MMARVSLKREKEFNLKFITRIEMETLAATKKKWKVGGSGHSCSEGGSGVGYDDLGPKERIRWSKGMRFLGSI